jgi:glucose-1-phosphate adenylyltransferase
MPLTRDRAKPAVPFGGQYRLVDFALSSLVNGGYRRILVLTQYKSDSLNRHISLTWRMSPLLGNYVTSVPAQMRVGERWFLGSADAVFQNLNIVRDERPEHVFVFGADHIYRMDPGQMLEQHVATGAGVTVAAIRMPIEEASQFGVIERGATTQIEAFREKPDDPKPIPDDPGLNFADNDVPGSVGSDRGYWRDVGTIDAYYDASMDLVHPEPVFSLYNEEWPIYTASETQYDHRQERGGAPRLDNRSRSRTRPSTVPCLRWWRGGHRQTGCDQRADLISS